MEKTQLALIFLILFSACGNKEEEAQLLQAKQRAATIAQIEQENADAIKQLINKNEALAGWDTGNWYTFLLQEEIVDSSRVIAFPGEVADIFKRDSAYYLLISHNFIETNSPSREPKDYQACVRLDQEEFKRLRLSLENPEYKEDGLFILQVSSIIPYAPQLNHEITHDWGEPEIKVSLDYAQTYLTFHGKLLDFTLLRKNPLKDPFADLLLR